MNDRAKMVAKATQTIDDSFPISNTDFLLTKLLEEVAQTNTLLESIKLLLEEDDSLDS